MRTPFIRPSEIPVLHRPEWIQVRAPGGATYRGRDLRPSQRRTCRLHSAEAMLSMRRFSGGSSER